MHLPARAACAARTARAKWTARAACAAPGVRATAVAVAGATAVLLAAAGTHGCATLGTLQTANTLGAGNFQMGLEPAFEMGVGTPQPIYVPRFDLALRYGVADRVDLAGRIGSTGLELGAKFQLTDPADKGLVLSLAPSVAGGAVPIPDNPIGVVYVTLPLLLGVGVGHGHQLVFAGKVANWMLLGDIGLSSLVLDELVVGGSVGFVLKLHEKFRLMPEVSVMRPVWVSEDLGGTSMMGSAAFGNAFLVQFSVAALFFGGGGPAYATSPSSAPDSAPAAAPAE